MLRHDLHLHTCFSAGCTDGPRAFCLQAIDRGYRAICITDHANMSEDLFPYELGRQAVLACREEFGDRLAIGFGVEICYRRTWEERIRDFLRGKEFDYVLGSVHHLEERDFVTDQLYFAGKTQRQAYEEYFAEVLRLAESGLCHGLAHLDVIERRGAKIYGSYDASEYADSLAPIFAAAVRRGLAVEINLSGYRQGLGKPTPGLDVLDLYGRAGGRLVTIGSDAHRAFRACPEHAEVWEHVEKNDFVLWEPSPGFWSAPAAGR